MVTSAPARREKLIHSNAEEDITSLHEAGVISAALWRRHAVRVGGITTGKQFIAVEVAVQITVQGATQSVTRRYTSESKGFIAAPVTAEQRFQPQW